ncbi:hypothetical protein [Fundicoccus culcitae]|uniref:Uncharacterized protein n=1 Tax=Fundicoccus culcitae TaxID=2969821 RepID=A0ABY5P3X0_9LACT|nr:hypothetical protein [Fundicoccus culcitae]UUX33105.1 hypothetical protein NRE15_09310 [Fundicoccus culcitae]
MAAQEQIKQPDISQALTPLTTLDAAVETAWADYQSILNTFPFWDQARSADDVMGIDMESILAEFTPEATLRREENQLIYSYATEAFQSLDLRLIFFNDELYNIELVGIPETFTEDMLASLDDLEPIIAKDFPSISTILDRHAFIFGVSNMVKDGQLGTGLLFLAGDSLETANIELMLYLDDTAVNSIYFPAEILTNMLVNGFDRLPNDLNFYMLREFTISPILNELINRNTTSNQGFRQAQNAAEYIFDTFTVRNLQDQIEGDTLETVLETFVTPVAPTREVVHTNMERLTYNYAGDDGMNGQLNLMFFDNQLAFVSTMDSSLDPFAATVLGASRPIYFNDLSMNESLTPLITKPFDAYAMATMNIAGGNHQVLVAPVAMVDVGIRVALIDIEHYRITAITFVDVLPEGYSLDMLLFEHIFSQYTQ